MSESGIKVIALTFGVAGCVIVLVSIFIGARYISLRSYNETEATVLGVRQFRDFNYGAPGGAGDSVGVAVEFRYNVNGAELVSDIYMPDLFSLGAGLVNRRFPKEVADRLVDEFDIGQRIVVQYDSNSPENSYVENTDQVGRIVFFIFFGLAIIAVSGLTFFGILKPA